jgi:hypothetical protein
VTSSDAISRTIRERVVIGFAQYSGLAITISPRRYALAA